jgi:hypothetical protein
MSMNTFYGANPPKSSLINLSNTSIPLERGKRTNEARGGANERASAGSLGIFTKSDATLLPQGLQRIHDFLLQDQSAKLLPKERVCNCLKKRIDKDKLREVKYNETRKKAHWANVQRCGSIWTCPVCAKQITEKRREELKTGLETWKNAHSGGVLLLTLTFSHSVGESLKSLLMRQKRAYKRFIGHRRVIALMASISVQHKIKGFELTYGANGWHPHNHILLLTKHTVLNFHQYKDELSKIWINCCIMSGLSAPSMQHGLDIRDGSYAEKYVSKWGLEHELTKGHVKKGRNGGFTPFDLLQLSTIDKEINGRSAASLFQEYAISLKGARQLVWSRGLKALLAIEEKTDEQHAQETEHEAIKLCEVDNFIFGLLCNYQARHEYLVCLENDYENGCFGSGEAEKLLVRLLEIDIQRFKNIS